LANFGKDGRPERIIAKVSQETLAEMIGTTRSRVSHFMNKFRKLGFIDYNGHLEVHSSLLNVVLHDQPQISGAHAAAGSSDAKVAWVIDTVVARTAARRFILKSTVKDTAAKRFVACTTVSPVPTPVEMVTIDPRDLQAAQDRDKAMPPV
jgi:DNA-binding transcriptional regulator LsrR (DeoR family)